VALARYELPVQHEPRAIVRWTISKRARKTASKKDGLICPSTSRSTKGGSDRNFKCTLLPARPLALATLCVGN
jgi:hypothetical protein